MPPALFPCLTVRFPANMTAVHSHSLTVSLFCVLVSRLPSVWAVCLLSSLLFLNKLHSTQPPLLEAFLHQPPDQGECQATQILPLWRRPDRIFEDIRQVTNLEVTLLESRMFPSRTWVLFRRDKESQPVKLQVTALIASAGNGPCLIGELQTTSSHAGEVSLICIRLFPSWILSSTSSGLFWGMLMTVFSD